MSAVELTKILQEELSLLQSIKEQEEQLHVVLVEGKAKELQELNHGRENLLRKMQELEKKRKDLVGEQVTLGDFIAREFPPQESELLHLKEQLVGLNNSIKRLQKINKNLLRFNLKQVRYLRQKLMPQAENVSYAPSGDLNYGGTSSAVLDDDA